jgi:hypothetical protein
MSWASTHPSCHGRPGPAKVLAGDTYCTSISVEYRYANAINQPAEKFIGLLLISRHERSIRQHGRRFNHVGDIGADSDVANGFLSLVVPDPSTCSTLAGWGEFQGC